MTAETDRRPEASSLVGAEADRAEFEAWLDRQSHALWPYSNVLWIGWQARAAAERQAKPVALVARCRKCGEPVGCEHSTWCEYAKESSAMHPGVLPHHAAPAAPSVAEPVACTTTAEAVAAIIGWVRLVEGHTGPVAAEVEWGAAHPMRLGQWRALSFYYDTATPPAATQAAQPAAKEDMPIAFRPEPDALFVKTHDGFAGVCYEILDKRGGGIIARTPFLSRAQQIVCALRATGGRP